MTIILEIDANIWEKTTVLWNNRTHDMGGEHYSVVGEHCSLKRKDNGLEWGDCLVIYRYVVGLEN